MGPRVREDDGEWWKRLRVFDETDHRSSAVRITNECVASVAVADPVKRAHTSPICGSAEKIIAIADSGVTKIARLKVMSVSPQTRPVIAHLRLRGPLNTRIP